MNKVIPSLQINKINTHTLTLGQRAEVLTQRRSLGEQRGGADQLHTPSEYYRRTHTHIHRREEKRMAEREEAVGEGGVGGDWDYRKREGGSRVGRTRGKEAWKV